MAATLLRRSTVVWVPRRSIGERGFVNEQSLLAMPPAAAGATAHWQRVSIEAMPASKSVTLLFDARDVTLLPVRLPPLSGTRLARALPNLIEDSVLQDAQSCAIAMGPQLDDGSRLLAVIDRAWLEFVVGAFERRGMKVAAAWPAQLALPWVDGTWSLGIAQGGIAVRTGEHEGFGWTASQDRGALADSLVAALEAAAPAGAGAPHVAAFVEDDAWRGAVAEAAERIGKPIAIALLPEPHPPAVDLLRARLGTAGTRWFASVDWRAWRLPAGIAAAALVAYLIGMNLHWFSLGRERDALRAQMVLTFREAFPNAQVVVDPLLQMQRQVADLRLSTGSSGPGDYVALLARLSEALGPRATDAMAALEYRDGRLRARFRPEFLDGPAARDGLADACRQRGLAVEFEGEGETTVAIVRPA